jgi:Sulfatase
MAFRVSFLLARILVVTYVILTAAYCLLAYIPFTYHQVVVGALLPWLSAFATFHSYFYWPAFAAAGLTLPWHTRKTRLGSIAFMVVYGAIGILLSLNPLLLHLENNLRSLAWCIFSLAPLLWLAALDWTAESGILRWAEQPFGETRRLFHACLLTAFYAWFLWTLSVIARTGWRGKTGMDAGQWVTAIFGSLLFHLLASMAAFLVLNFIQTLAAIVFSSFQRRLLLCAFSMVAMLAALLKVIVFAPISFFGQWATATAFATAFSMVFSIVGISARLYRAESGEIAGPIAFLLFPASFLRSFSRIGQWIVLVAVSAIVAWLSTAASVMDWEYMLQKLLAVVVFAGAFSFFYITAPAPKRRSGDALVVGATVLIFLYLGFIALPSGRRVIVRQKSLSEYANYDVSFRLASGVLSPPRTSDSGLFYSFLLGNTNIPRSTHLDPVNIELAGALAQTAGPKPNIFIFVIDSLRRDYLSTYNPGVDFTPNIAAFARESDVAQNAFTHYTGTGLSEPSIWTGTLMLHQQYITPFAPMNSLQKLLEFEQYRQFITRDEILSNILGPSKLITNLDAGRATMNCELCQSLQELEGRIAETAPAGRPMFAYTQPQNIHVSVINRQSRSVPDGESYLGFDAAYASRVRSMDRCFGNFIQFLKSRGLYENSVVILTADHGDSLGEGGRWGHAYHITPEVVRIPLIVHLPTAEKSLRFDPSAPTFLTDLTPSLYYLLGHKPIVKSGLYGKPLFTDTSEEKKGYPANSYLVASSYGPVYGLLLNSGHSLYVANAVEYGDYAYEWGEDSRVSSDPVSPEIRANRQQQIRNDVSEIGRFYGFAGALQ